MDQKHDTQPAESGRNNRQRSQKEGRAGVWWASNGHGASMQAADALGPPPCFVATTGMAPTRGESFEEQGDNVRFRWGANRLHMRRHTRPPHGSRDMD